MHYCNKNIITAYLWQWTLLVEVLFCIYKILIFIYSDTPSYSYTAFGFAVLIKKVFPIPTLYMSFSIFVFIKLFNSSGRYFYIWQRIKYGLGWVSVFLFFQMNSWLCQHHLLNIKVPHVK